MLRFLTAGESHGQAEIAILEGLPAGLNLQIADIQKDLDKRRLGAGRGGRGQIEKDQIKILSGVRLGKTLGSPIALYVENTDFANWKNKMSIYPKMESEAKITNPRPGHTDLVGALKYNFDDLRNVIERASARETIMRVAVGAVCKKLLAEFKIKIGSHTIQIGNIRSNAAANFEEIENIDEFDPEIRCLDKIVSHKMKQAILEATRKRDTLGGIVEIQSVNVPPGLGSYVHYDRKLDSQLACILMSIPSVKAVEIGEGINNTIEYGSKVHDEIFYDGKNYYRNTNRAGGIEGGVSNGEIIKCRVYHKPLSTLGNPLKSIDIKTKQQSAALIERSDVCVVPRAGVISEAATAFVLAKCMIEKFAGDSLAEMSRNFEGYMRYLTTI